jgi:hypothetical protein
MDFQQQDRKRKTSVKACNEHQIRIDEETGSGFDIGQILSKE